MGSFSCVRGVIVRGAGGEGRGVVVIGFAVVGEADDGNGGGRLMIGCEFELEGWVVGDSEELLGGVEGGFGGSTVWEVDAMLIERGARREHCFKIILSYLI